MIFILSVNSWAVCISNKLAMDVDCECKSKKTCLQFSNAAMKNEISFSMRKSDPDKVKKIYKYVIPAYKDVNKMFDGSKTNKDYKNVDAQEISKDTKKLENINKKLLKSLEAQYKKQNKKFSFDKYKKYYNQQVKKVLKKEVRETNRVPPTVISKALGIKMPKVSIPGGGDMNPAMASVGSSSNSKVSGIEDGSVDKEKVKAILNNKKLSKEQKDRELAKLRAKKMKRKNFKYDDISPKHTKIFDLISKRYRMVENRLDQNAVYRDRLNDARESGVNYMIDSFLR